MQRSRIGLLGSSLIAGIAGMLAVGGMDLVTLDRERPVSTKHRHIAPSAWENGSSRYQPHIGAKEQERAKRLWESEFLNEPVASINPRIGHKRSSPTLCQFSKRFYEAEERAMFNV